MDCKAIHPSSLAFFRFKIGHLLTFFSFRCISSSFLPFYLPYSLLVTYYLQYWSQTHPRWRRADTCVWKLPSLSRMGQVKTVWFQQGNLRPVIGIYIMVALAKWGLKGKFKKTSFYQQKIRTQMSVLTSKLSKKKTLLLNPKKTNPGQ